MINAMMKRGVNMEKIVLLHTNDLHSHFENWPKIRRFLREQKEQHEKNGDTVITVDLGDFSDRWHPLTEATNGQANVLLMNEIGYDAATIGNNEGVGNSKEELNHLYDHAEFDVILGNLFDKKTLLPPEWTIPYKIIETAQKTKVALIAFTAPFPLTYSPNGWDIRNPFDILPEMIEMLKKEADVIVLMSHLGIQDDFLIAQELPAIDVILGSHTHHLFEIGKKINQVQLSAAGKYGQYVGEVFLTLNEKKQILQTSAKAVATQTLPAIPEDENEIQGYLDEGHRLLKEKKVANLPFSLTTEVFGEHPFVLEALEALKRRGKTEAAILNSGLFLTDLPEGIITQDDLHTALPHPMHLLRVTLSGENLIRLILEMEKNRNFLRNFPMNGMGFRGKIFGQIIYSGITYDSVNHQILWQNRPIEKDRSYTFTTVDHFMFIPFFPTIEIAGENEFLFPEFIRSVVGDYLNAHYPIK
ncbi:Ser/Thr phosphatase family protein [Enterococcus faecalis 13-SD-W-01]|nr:Ser/Thr phosphatase family protein [Enterococcus faecalis 13-SD-W-01]